MPLDSNPTPFLHFALAAEQARVTTKRLEKAASVARLFDELSDTELAYAARYLAGGVFPASDQRTTNVGGSLLFSAIVAVSGADGDTARKSLVDLGDLGDLAFELFAASVVHEKASTLTITAVAETIDAIADTGGAVRKAQLVRDLLTKATPLEAKYLVKLLVGDLRIGLQEGAVEDAIARWAGVPVADIQWANMLIGDIGDSAVMARRGTIGDARMRLFHPLKFMLATPASDLADIVRQMPDHFVVEDKYDGIRAQAHVLALPVEQDSISLPGDTLPAIAGVTVANRRVALFSRTLDDITASFPDLVAPLAALLPDGEPGGDGLILDGEILAMRGDEVVKFRELQNRLGRKAPSPELLAQTPVTFMAYDLLYKGTELRIDLHFEERRALLERLPLPKAGVKVAPSAVFDSAMNLDDVFDASRARGNEGLMVKDPNSSYKPGRRGREWLKIKRALATLDVVVTAVEVGNGRRSKVLSDYTFAVRASESDPTLLNIGKAYSGLTDIEIAELSEWFKAHTLQEFAHGRVRVVQPSLVIEVTFDLVQPSTRHKSGYALRFPRIVRVRSDKPASEIDTLQTVARLAEGKAPEAPTAEGYVDSTFQQAPTPAVVDSTPSSSKARRPT